MQIQRDVMVETREGSLIAVNVFRPDGDAPVPVIASMSPYGKDVHWPERYPLYEVADQGDHAVWETPSPEWWTARGYAVVRADTRGTGKSPGRLDLNSPKEIEDFYDVIEWCGTQPWSTGKVASSGISWYAVMSWRVAALQPPHLAAVVAWEGLTDWYRESGRQGGIYANGGMEGWWQGQIEPQRNSEDFSSLPDELGSRELLDDWYRERTVDLSRVTVPVLSAGNWGSIHLHLRGNIEGWLGAASDHKWLVVHVGSHIDPYYSDWGKELQLRFLDRFLKGDEAAMDGVPPVRLAIRRGHEAEWRDEQEWPLARTQWRQLYLHKETLDWEAPTEGTLPYPATFDFVATERLELTGPVALRLWVSHVADDLDAFVRLEQYDVNGERIPALGPHGKSTPVPMAIGWLRASHRKLDPERSLPYRPWHTHDELQPLEPGVPALLEVEFWPTSLTLEPGQRLQLQLLTNDDDLHPRLAHNDPADRKSAEGATVHSGGEHASHLLVPVIPG
ncbi:CocE/NonD family hydrolase [Streptomyces sp. TRM68367]|uniref:CocE/NonD family hydrolase n=1 Tax=Streptomyces sp. TRM68367 TaxID=2758415 RepID=UPI00165ACA13|nr:CocE/NonD family hydrolase [Streptomyces sp. TRM68367]MBC9726581.1 CocE/NonD family hydrolase [Streptomyces sp. TRM68367]